MRPRLYLSTDAQPGEICGVGGLWLCNRFMCECAAKRIHGVSVRPSCSVLALRTEQCLAAQEELVQIYMDRGLEEDLARRVRHMPQAALSCVTGMDLLNHCVGMQPFKHGILSH